MPPRAMPRPWVQWLKGVGPYCFGHSFLWPPAGPVFGNFQNEQNGNFVFSSKTARPRGLSNCQQSAPGGHALWRRPPWVPWDPGRGGGSRPRGFWLPPSRASVGRCPTGSCRAFTSSQTGARRCRPNAAPRTQSHPTPSDSASHSWRNSAGDAPQPPQPPTDAHGSDPGSPPAPSAGSGRCAAACSRSPHPP